MHYPILMYVSLFSAVMPFSIGIYRWRYESPSLRILNAYLLFGLTVDILCIWFISNYWIVLGLMHLFFLIECIFIMSIIISLQESLKKKRLFKSLLLAYVLFWLIAKLTFEPINGLYSFTASLSAVLLTLSAGYTLFIVIGNRIQSLFSVYSFWILLSFIILYAGTLVFLATKGIILNYSMEEIYLVESINWILKIIFNILVAVGFLCPQTPQ